MRRRLGAPGRAAGWGALLLLSCWTAGARAQVLCPAATYNEDILDLEVQAAVELRSGNASSRWIHDSVCGRMELGQHRASLRFTHAFGQASTDQFIATAGTAGGDRVVNAIRLLPQYRYSFRRLGEWGELRGEALLHYERDEMRRHEHLLQVGLGPNLNLWDSEVLRLNITAAYLFEFEKFSRLRVPSDPQTATRDAGFELNAHRLWFALEVGWNIAERVFLGEELVFQVPLDHCACDTRVYAQTHLRIYGTDWLAMEMGAIVLYDSIPAVAVEQWDSILRTGLVFMLP